MTQKLLWHSVAPWCPTGYGQQTATFASRIADLDGYDLAISSGFGLQGSHLKWNGINVYPGFGSPGNQDWSNRVLQWAVHHGAGEPCTVITLIDVWPLDRETYKAVEQQGKLACWCPIDHQPAPPAVLDFLKATDAVPIAMSRFGETQLRQVGFDPLYVPHGVDTNIFQPLDRGQLREKLGFREEAFVVGMVANNQGVSPARKGFSEAFKAFSIFREKHDDALLFLHTEMFGLRNGLDLFRLLDRHGVPTEAYGFSEQIRLEYGMTPVQLLQMYNVFDVLLSPSWGEGFGIPIMEAQACGTPVIVSDWTAMPELCGAGWKVDGDPWDDTAAEAQFLKPSVESIVDALEKAYEQHGNTELRSQAREFALQYDADKVLTDYWVPALEAIHRPREVQPLRPNRAMRRAKAKAA